MFQSRLELRAFFASRERLENQQGTLVTDDFDELTDLEGGEGLAADEDQNLGILRFHRTQQAGFCLRFEGEPHRVPRGAAKLAHGQFRSENLPAGDHGKNAAHDCHRFSSVQGFKRERLRVHGAVRDNGIDVDAGEGFFSPRRTQRCDAEDGQEEEETGAHRVGGFNQTGVAMTSLRSCARLLSMAGR